MEEGKIDTTNKWMVGVMGGGVIVLRAPGALHNEEVHNEEALVLAAYLVTFADPDGERFQRVLEAVQNA